MRFARKGSPKTPKGLARKDVSQGRKEKTSRKQKVSQRKRPRKQAFRKEGHKDSVALGHVVDFRFDMASLTTKAKQYSKRDSESHPSPRTSRQALRTCIGGGLWRESPRRWRR